MAAPAQEARGIKTPSDLQRETAEFRPRGGDLVVATYNRGNLDPVEEDVTLAGGRSPAKADDDVGSGRLAQVAEDIAQNLRGPDILAEQEVQDGDGAEITDLVSAEATLQALVEAIVAAGGPRCAFLDNPFIGNGADLDGDGRLDTLVAFTDGGSVALLGVTSASFDNLFA